ncbi:MAG: hypothetical protein E7Z91_01570 [Cyanobacteria bacterium SIG30]|nr:hypothetical protein [Cyanobacteria bacterium SIG30]
MRLEGGIYINQSGLSQSIRAMHMQTELMNIASENVTGFDKIGYQRHEPVVSSFSEIIGIHGISRAIDDQVGRIFNTNSPLDCAIATKGYFQLLNKDGSIKLTRDGRFKINKDGEIIGLNGENLLSVGGEKIKLSVIPEEAEDIKITSDGKIGVFDPKTRKMQYETKISVVTSEGAVIPNPDIKQGYLEASNVSIQQEFFEMVPVRRNFDANRQMFMLQRSNLSRAIQELGGG